jgi:hypothetical protein
MGTFVVVYEPFTLLVEEVSGQDRDDWRWLWASIALRAIKEHIFIINTSYLIENTRYVDNIGAPYRGDGRLLWRFFASFRVVLCPEDAPTRRSEHVYSWRWAPAWEVNRPRNEALHREKNDI